MIDKIAGWMIGAIAIVGVVFMFQGVAMIEAAPVADMRLLPCISRAFHGIVLILVAMVGQAVRENA